MSWYVDVDMTLPEPLDNDKVTELLESAERFHPAAAYGGEGNETFVGLSLWVDAGGYFAALQEVGVFITSHPMLKNHALLSMRVVSEAVRQKENVG